ncbi:MAG: hypothetical protein KME42_03430 [Tildeniella nuda ZEHNDER 1965/U140]|nr:hypothetical protein [Tildeniella nuda ZEHNDER 1965/U140]
MATLKIILNVPVRSGGVRRETLGNRRKGIQVAVRILESCLMVTDSCLNLDRHCELLETTRSLGRSTERRVTPLSRMRRSIRRKAVYKRRFVRN